MSRVISTLDELEHMELLFTARPEAGPLVTLVVEGAGLSPISAEAAAEDLASDLRPVLADWVENTPPRTGGHAIWLLPPCQGGYPDTTSIAEQLESPDAPFQLSIRWRRLAIDLRLRAELDELAWRAASSPPHLHRVEVLRDLFLAPTHIEAEVALRTERRAGRHLRSVVAEGVAGCVVGCDEWASEPVRFLSDVEARSQLLMLATAEHAEAGRSERDHTSTSEGARHPETEELQAE